MLAGWISMFWMLSALARRGITDMDFGGSGSIVLLADCAGSDGGDWNALWSVKCWCCFRDVW